MNAYTKTLEAILKKYPNAKEIYKKITGSEFGNELIEDHFSCLNSYNYKTIIENEFISNENEINYTDNVFFILKKTLSEAISKDVKKLLYENNDIIYDMEYLERHLCEQVANTLPEDIRQLCLFITKMNSSTSRSSMIWLDIFTSYPMLPDKIALHIGHIIEAIKNVLFNLKNDTSDLIDNFMLEEFKIKKIDISLGDYHSFGSCVSKITFSKSAEIVFKPRTAKNELIVEEILTILMGDLDDIEIGIPKCISMNAHSWHENINFCDSESPKDVLKFYKNIGAAVGFFHMLNGSDFHYENVICYKSKPYFIDLECVFSGVIQTNHFSNSVLTTSIIPGLSGSAIDRFICGVGERDLNGQVDKQILYIDKGLEIIKNNKKIKLPNFYNRPIKYRAFTSNDALRDAALTGFESIISAFKKNTKIVDVLVAKGSLKGRILLRSSKYYADVINFSSHPRYTLFPQLRLLFIACALFDKIKPQGVIKYEFSSISQRRIPVFYYDLFNSEFSYGSDHELVKNKKGLFYEKFYAIQDFLDKYARVHNSVDEISYQRQLLNISLWSLLPSKVELSSAKITNDSYLQFLKGDMVTCQGDDVWLGIKKDFYGTPVIIKRNDNLYDGLAGPLILQLCDFISEPLLKKECELINLYEQADKQKKIDTFGAFESNGGLLYIDYLFIKHFGVEYFSRFKKRLDGVIASYKKNKKFDIISGSSGILIICCRVYSLNPCDRLKDIMIFLTNDIIKNSLILDVESVTWGKKWTGFSHGNSGIAYALALVNNFLNRDEIKNLILKSLNYEKKFKISSGWKGVDIHDKDQDFNAWCNGAPGIYMSRQAMLNEIDSIDCELIDFLYSDIEHYHETKSKRGKNNNLSLCHGLFGNTMIDPGRDSSSFNIDINMNNLSLEKSLMTGEIGAAYANLFLNSNGVEMPNILLLK